MLAAENPSVDGHLAASTPLKGGMDCKSNNNANKKLIQARLPFKRLNTEPKENQPPKRPRAPACPQPVDSDEHNENVSTPLSERSGPPLVNGRGPIDGFFSRRHLPPSDEKVIIDLTAESSPIKGFTPPAAACHPAKSKLCAKDKPASSEQPLNVEDTSKPRSSDSVTISDDEGEQSEAEDPPASTSQLDTTQDSNSEPEEQNESGNVSSSENRSTQSASPGSPLSESSPENKEAGDATPTRTPKEMQSTPTLPSGQKNAKRRSLKSLQEQEERLRLRQEKERQKEEAKAEKEKKKEEARKLKEKREKEKRERKEKDEREKREKKEKDEKEKAERVKAKEELRKSKIEAKLEEKRKKEEEKRMKEEEKRLKEEKDRVKAEKAEITRFLQKSKTQQVPKTLAAACGKFAPFEIKENMALAPLTRVQCNDSVLEDLDHYLLNPAEKGNALEDWIGKKPRQSGATKVRQTDSPSDCIVAEGPKPDGVPDRKRYGPMKLLQFHENYRPAYWGTWSKKSSNISPRCPFKQDKDLLDYEVDSDEEWEEEEPGESLSHSEGEDEEEGGEDDDDDDGFFVPHGYLSEDEGALEEEESGDLEKQKLRQKLKAREWDELMSCKKKMKVLEPVVRGCVWEGEGDGLEILQCYAVCVFEPLPKADTSPSPEELSQRVQREDHLLGQLLPLLHGNVNSCKVIITEFQEFCRQSSSAASASPPDSVTPRSQTDNIPTRIQLRRLVKNNAVYEKRSNHRRCCWYVHAEVLSRYGQEALPVPCHWTYLTTGAREEPREEHSSPANPQGNPPSTPSMPSSSSKRKSTGSLSITKFMKRRSEPRQTEAAETDGFQADTEDDEDDCIIVSTHNGPNQDSPPSESDSPMEVAPSNSSALPESST
ncbi:Chromatin assembly factor 1 subunit A [Oryzias melastigma]|uniref:Chromatin assembly factor 1 subunit A n=1 Tax=Oryzias melastigma TaxID=30732 RepID=A0A834CEB5_ORYME|nr:Chromatin assembly factor 1 subunit A [Oryzias melastigma]